MTDRGVVCNVEVLVGGVDDLPGGKDDRQGKECNRADGKREKREAYGIQEPACCNICERVETPELGDDDWIAQDHHNSVEGHHSPIQCRSILAEQLGGQQGEGEEGLAVGVAEEGDRECEEQQPGAGEQRLEYAPFLALLRGLPPFALLDGLLGWLALLDFNHHQESGEGSCDGIAEEYPAWVGVEKVAGDDRTDGKADVVAEINQTERDLAVFHGGEVGFHRFPCRVDHAVEEEGQQDQVGDYRFSFKETGQHEAEIHHQLEDYQYWFPSDGIGELAADHGAGDVQYGCKGHVRTGLQGGVTKTSGEVKRQKWIDENAHGIDDGGEKEYVDGLGETAIDTQARFHRTASMASANPSSLLFLVTAMA